MKHKRKAHKVFDALDAWWMVLLFAIVGFIIRNVWGGLIGGGIGFAAICTIEIWWPFEASELEWSDIGLAVNNYSVCYVPGIGGIKFICKDRTFVFEKREVFRYTKDKAFVVWYKSKQWADLLSETDEPVFTDLCGRAPVRDVGLEESKTFLIPQQEDTGEVLGVCLKLIKHLISKTGATVSNVFVRDRVADYSIWVDPRYQEAAPVPIGSFNFKGKKDGQPVIALTNRKGYWILHEDGTLEAFADFDEWWNEHENT